MVPHLLTPRLYSFSVKAAIATSAVYWTIENKVWGTSSQSTNLYNKLRHDAEPTLKSVRKQIPIEVGFFRYSIY